MKILIVADTYYPDVNGCSYFTQRLAYYKAKNGHQVGVIAPSRSLRHTKEKKDNIEVFGVSAVPIFINGMRVVHPFFIQSQMTKILEEFKPDIIHMQSHFSLNKALWKVAMSKKLPIIFTNHFMPDNLTHYFPLPKKAIAWLNEYMWRDFAKVVNQIPYVATPTEIAANLIRPRLSVPVTPVTCGVDLERFNPLNNGDYLRERFHILNDTPILLSVGRLDAEKHVEQVIEASAKAMEEVDFSLVIAGKGVEAQNLQKLAKKLGIEDHVFFTGFVSDEDLPYLYTIADCFVNACPFELQCIVALEAMASGLPLICVNAGALPHLAHDEENGYLFPVGDVDTLREKIVDLMSHEAKRKEMGHKSLELIGTHSIDIMIEGYARMYAGAIEIRKN